MMKVASSVAATRTELQGWRIFSEWVATFVVWITDAFTVDPAFFDPLPKCKNNLAHGV